jgi:sugar phosphate isomerase/epimerase
MLFPEHWIPVLEDEACRPIGTVSSSEEKRSRRLLVPAGDLDGTTDWPKVGEAFDKANYSGHLTVEHFKPWRHCPEALVYQASDALDRIPGRG